MDFTINGIPVNKITIEDGPGEKEPLDLELRVNDVLELFKLQSMRSAPYGPRGDGIEPFGKEPGPHWVPAQIWQTFPDGTCDPHTLTVNNGSQVEKYREYAEVYHGDYKIQAALRMWLCMGGIKNSASISAVSDVTGFPFLERDSFLWRVDLEALSEAMFQCFYYKWLHNWERPIPAVDRALETPDQYPKLVAALETDANARNYSSVMTSTYPEGAPVHPSFPAGHGVCIGAHVTVFRAFFDTTKPARPGSSERTIGDELSANARAVALARMIAGIHFRRDMTAGLALGEAVARKVLAQYDLSPGDDVWWPEDPATKAFDLRSWKKES